MGEVARRLGKPLMPWQQYVADVVMEVDPVTGRLAYTEWRLTVPRQSGKSTLIMAKALHRCTATGFFGERQSAVYTAQTRKDARKKWEKDYAWQIQGSKTWGRLVDVRLGNGNEHMRFPNGSEWGIEAGTEKAGHGPTIDEAYIDEAFAQVDGRLEGAFSPAMITRANKQLGIVSTAGWLDGSPYLLEKVQTGRDLVEAGIRDRVAYFEWSADEDADPEDPATWWSCMPALGLTVTEEAIADELRSRDRNDFLRAYLNRWVLKDAPEDAIVDPGEWAELEDREDTRPDPVVFGLSTSPNRKWTTIGLAGRRSDGNTHLQTVQSGRGTAWVPAKFLELAEKWGRITVAVDGADQAASLRSSIESRKITVKTLTAREMAHGCGMFVQGVDEGTIRHTGGRQLPVSLGVARKRRLGEGWVWDGPRDGSADVAPLKAVTVALYTLSTVSAKARTGVVV